MDGRWLKWTIRSEIEQLWRENDGIKPKTRRLFQYILFLSTGTENLRTESPKLKFSRSKFLFFSKKETKMKN